MTRLLSLSISMHFTTCKSPISRNLVIHFTAPRYDFSMRFVNASNASNGNYSVASYQGGPFLAQLFSLFTQIVSNTLISSPVLSIHATHDTTIKPILNFFGQVIFSCTCTRHQRCFECAQSRDSCSQPSTPATPAASSAGRPTAPCSCSSCARTATEITLSGLCTTAIRFLCQCSSLPPTACMICRT